MTMLEAFTEELNKLPFELKIISEKSSNYKSKLVLEYEGEKTSVELNNTCTPGEEYNYCWNVIATAMSSIYIAKGDYKKGRLWLDALNDRSIISPDNY